MSWPYEPLQPGQIRLLTLVKAKKSSQDLGFKLQHVPIASKPKYSALSYVWGPSGITHTTQVDEKPFEVRQNLYEALRQLWDSKLIDGYLWVDAICINQGTNPDALKERSIQLTLMKQIYEHADRVLVWLGRPEDEECNRLAFQKIELFEKLFDKTMVKARPWRPWWYPTKARSSAEDVADFARSLNPAEDKTVFDRPGSQTHKAWLGIMSLLKHPWWTRTWVLQEATVPEQWQTYHVRGLTTYRLPSKVRFIRGDQQTTWNALNAVYHAISSVVSTPGIDATILHGTLQNFVPLRDFRAYRVLLQDQSFEELLQTFRYTSCYDPRDKVYAPLCLATEKDITSYVQPDYRKTALDVYKDVVRYYMSQSGSELDFLGFAKYEEGSQTVALPSGPTSVIPSWIPNFTVRFNGFAIPKLLHVPQKSPGRQLTVMKDPVKEFDRPTIPAYNPLPDSHSVASMEGDKLRVSGIYLDSLKEIVPLDSTHAEDASNEQGDDNFALRWADESGYTYKHTAEKLTDACNRTLVMDVVYDASGRPAARGDFYDNDLLTKQRQELSPAEYRRQLNMQIAVHRASRLRSLALSRKLYISNAPDVAKIGDEMWALSGGNVLYILRRVDTPAQLQEYLYIGECYTHGLMDGEIAKMIDSGEASLQAIFLV